MKKIIHLFVTLIFALACTPVFAEDAATNCVGEGSDSNCGESSAVEAEETSAEDGALEPLIITEETPISGEETAEEEAETETWTLEAKIVAGVFAALVLATFIFTIKE